MAIKLAAVGLVLVLLAVLLQGSILGGDGGRAVSVARPSSIPTATPPANLPEPILLGETQGTQNRNTNTGGGANVYVVKSGDTLGAIASGQGVSADQQAAWVAEVLRLNGIEDARLLKAGQELTLPRIPTQPASTQTTGTPRPAGTPGAATATRPPGTQIGAPTAPPATNTTPRPTTTTGGVSGNIYTVQANDFPLLIAQKVGIPENQQLEWAQRLLSLNGVEASGLRVGQVLQLPPATGGSTSPSATSTRTP